MLVALCLHTFLVNSFHIFHFHFKCIIIIQYFYIDLNFRKKKFSDHGKQQSFGDLVKGSGNLWHSEHVPQTINKCPETFCRQNSSILQHNITAHSLENFCSLLQRRLLESCSSYYLVLWKCETFNPLKFLCIYFFCQSMKLL